MYKIGVESDNKIIGRVDGIAVTILSTPSLKKYKNIPEYSKVEDNLLLDCFMLDDKAKLVDFFSIGGSSHILITRRIKEELEKLKLYNIQFIKSVVLYKDKILTDYYLLHIYSKLYDLIDLDKTEFVYAYPAPISEIVEEYGILNKAQLDKLYLDLFGGIALLRPKTKYNFYDFDINAWDMFKIGKIDDGIYVSDKLREALLNINAKGCWFAESNLF